MPNRVMRDGLIYSDAVNAVSDAGEVLYLRMVLAADDFGLIEASPGFLKSRCLPARDWSREKIEGAFAELVGARLVRTYEADGKRYAAIEKWEQRRWAKHPKYPEPAWGREHIRGGWQDERTPEQKNPGRKRKATSGVARGTTVPPGFEAFWQAYPRKVAKPAALRAFTALKLENGQLERVMAAVEAQKASEGWRKENGRFIPHPATWLNQRRFEDEGARVEPAWNSGRARNPDGTLKVVV